MWCTDVLREEHRWILRLLACLERLAVHSERDGRLDASHAAECLALFTHFADGLHQEREERYVFPRLLARARSVEERVRIGQLCGEHEEERRAMARMSRELLSAVYGHPRSLHEFQCEALRYVGLQREHVLEENRTVLPLAEDLLTREDDEGIMQGFVSLEHEGPVKTKRVFERIRELSEHMVVP